MTGDDTIYLSTDEQLRAVNNHTRHRIIGLLRATESTTTQVAERLGIAKGSASYHLRLLERAGIATVVRTNKIRGVHERYYALAARRIELPDPGAGQPDILMRQAIADLEAAAPDDDRIVALRHARISRHRYAEFSERLRALLRELTDEDVQGVESVELAVAFFRSPGAR